MERKTAFSLAKTEKSTTDPMWRDLILAWWANLAEQLVRTQGLTPTLALNRLMAIGLADLGRVDCSRV